MKGSLAAGMAALPEASAHTSIKQRVDHVAAQGRSEDLKGARTSSAVASRQAAGLEEILDRLQTSAEQWHARLDRLRTGRPLGRFFAATRARLREIGTRLNLKHVPNLGA